RRTPKTKKGQYKARFFQTLTPDIGHPDLNAQIYKVLGIMRISSNWKDFKEKFNVMTSREDGIIELDLEFDEDK
ncbi:TPA: hypothetical protein ACG10U_002005, partial [Streptococcus agalactiae]|nr:hypothetical protein [Streptococcus agalactiae]